MATNVGGVVLDTSVLDKITKELEPKASRIVRQYGIAIAGDAVKRAPVDTGNLINTILANSKLISNLVFRVQDGTEYGIFVELGHITALRTGNYNVRRFVAAKPFLVPAVEAWRNKFIAAFSELFK